MMTKNKYNGCKEDLEKKAKQYSAKRTQEENLKIRQNIRRIRVKLFTVLTLYELGNYDINIHQFYKEVYEIHNELMNWEI